MKFEDIIYYEKVDTMIENILDLLEEYGTVPPGLKEELERQRDMTLLKKWLKLAAHVTSIEEFMEKM